MPQVVIRNRALEPLHKFRPLRTRPHESHVAFQHVPELRNLIETRFTKKASELRYARIVVRCPLCAALRFRIHAHRPELIKRERFSTTTYALLLEEDRPRGR